MATTEAEAIARDWNGFDKEEIVREFGAHIDLNERTYTFTVSDLAKERNCGIACLLCPS